MAMQHFLTLKVWAKAHHLKVKVYRATRTFLKEELYGLTRQLRDCSASIGANIAEGCVRNGAADFARFLYIAMGSAAELENHLLLARDLKLLTPPQFGDLSRDVTEVKRMLTSFIQKIRAGAR
jgi:four helix bundle protein